jgi:hypothetical protein
MKRRKFILGTGAAAAGGASLLGSGAFTSVQADRSVSVNVVGDANALLRLAPCEGSSNGDYVTGAADGAMAIDLSESNKNVDGNGVNPEARTTIHNVFEICNQGTQNVCVDFSVDAPEIPSDADVPDRYGFGPGDPAVIFYRGDNRDEFISTAGPNPDRPGSINLDTGGCECVGFEVRSFGRDAGEDLFNSTNLTIHAEAGSDCVPGVSDPVPRILGPSDGLVSYWPLDSIEDGTAEDIVGGNDGTPKNGVSETGGKVDDAASFDGIDDYVTVPDDSSLDLTEALTLAAWVKPSSDQESYARIISREQSGVGNRQYNLGVNQSAEDPRTVIDTVDDDAVEISGEVPFTDDSWHHAVMTFEASSEVRLYVDGDEVDSTSVNSSLVSRSSTVKFGAPAHLPDKDYFTGGIDDIRIYDRALSGSEVADLYTATE